jgi:hypothetical protein
MEQDWQGCLSRQSGTLPQVKTARKAGFQRILSDIAANIGGTSFDAASLRTVAQIWRLGCFERGAGP